MEQHLRADHHGVAAARGKGASAKRLAPYGLVGPGTLWLLVFFLVPMFAMLLALAGEPPPSVGFLRPGTSSRGTGRSTPAPGPVPRAVRAVPGLRGRRHAVTLVVGYPVAYWIAFKGGSRRRRRTCS